MASEKVAICSSAANVDVADDDYNDYMEKHAYSLIEITLTQSHSKFSCYPYLSCAEMENIFWQWKYLASFP